MRPKLEDLSETHQALVGVRDPGGQFNLGTFGMWSRWKWADPFTHIIFVLRYGGQHNVHSRSTVGQCFQSS